MKITNCLLLAVGMLCNDIFAENHFVVKVSGDTLWGDSKFIHGFTASRVQVGKDTIPGDSVEYISSSAGIRARTPNGGFAELQKQGQEIDLFSYVQYGITGFPVVREYYRVNRSKLKSIKYENVKPDFGGYEGPGKLIEEYEFAERWDHWLMLGGIAIFASVLAIEPNPDEAGIPVKAVLSAGSLSFIFGAGFWLTKDGILIHAVHNYFEK